MFTTNTFTISTISKSIDKNVGLNNNRTDGKKEYPLAVAFIIANEFCERFAYYGIKNVLVLYLKNVLHYSEDKATEYYHIFTMLCYFTPIIGAYVADSLLGKYRTILYIYFVYTSGNLVLTFASYLESRWITWIGLALIAIGTGGVKPCVLAFGADQFGENQAENGRRKYFIIFYMVTNAGTLIATSVTPILRKEVSCSARGDCFPLAFGVPSALMLTSVCLFIAGRYIADYKIISPKSGNIVVTVIRCVFHALRNKLAIFSTPGNVNNSRKHWLDYADDSYDSNTISEIKRLTRVLLLYLPLPVFWALFVQQGSRWTLQATQMNGNLFGVYRLYPGQLNVINPLLIIVMVPLFEYAFYPLLAKLKLLKKPLQKMCFGGILAAVSFAICAVLQMRIENDMRVNGAPNETNLAVVNGMRSDLILNNDSLVFYYKSVSRIDSKLENILLKPQDGGVKVRVYFRIENFDRNSRDVNFLFNDQNFEIINYFDHKSGFADYRELDVFKIDSYNLYIKYSDSDAKLLLMKDIISGDNQGGCYVVVINGDYILNQTDSYSVCVNEMVGPNGVPMVQQVYQLVVMTIAEILFSVVGLEFSYSQAPKSMKSVLQAVWQLTAAFGNVIVAVIARVRLFEKQSTEFFFYSALMLADMTVFAVLAYRYKANDSSDNINQNSHTIERI